MQDTTNRWKSASRCFDGAAADLSDVISQIVCVLVKRSLDSNLLAGVIAANVPGDVVSAPHILSAVRAAEKSEFQVLFDDVVLGLVVTHFLESALLAAVERRRAYACESRLICRRPGLSPRYS